MTAVQVTHIQKQNEAFCTNKVSTLEMPCQHEMFHFYLKVQKTNAQYKPSSDI